MIMQDAACILCILVFRINFFESVGEIEGVCTENGLEVLCSKIRQRFLNR